MTNHSVNRRKTVEGYMYIINPIQYKKNVFLYNFEKQSLLRFRRHRSLDLRCAVIVAGNGRPEAFLEASSRDLLSVQKQCLPSLPRHRLK